MKPSYGAVSRSGVVDMAPTLDHVGPIAPDVETAATVLDVLTGYDPRDPVTAAAGRLSSASAAVADPPAVADCSFALPEELFGEHVEEAVRTHVRAIADDLADAGADVETVSLPTISDLVPVWKAIVNVELASMFLLAGAPVARRTAVDVGGTTRRPRRSLNASTRSGRRSARRRSRGARHR